MSNSQHHFGSGPQLDLAHHLPFSSVIGILIIGSLSSVQAQVSINCPSQSTQPTMAYGQRLTGCTLAQATAQESYVFSGTSNDLVRISLWQEAGPGVPCVEIFDPDAKLVGGQGCVTDFTLTLSQTGQYQIVVLAQGSTGVFQYDLRLDRIFPISPTSIPMAVGDIRGNSLQSSAFDTGYRPSRYQQVDDSSAGRLFDWLEAPTSAYGG